MNLLNELNNIGFNLSDYQKCVLLSTKLAATPLQAFDTTRGDMNMSQARDTLARIGFVSYSKQSLTLTPRGEEALIQYNLIDTTGMLTPDGEEIIKLAHSETDELNPSTDRDSYQ